MYIHILGLRMGPGPGGTRAGTRAGWDLDRDPGPVGPEPCGKRAGTRGGWDPGRGGPGPGLTIVSKQL